MIFRTRGTCAVLAAAMLVAPVYSRDTQGKQKKKYLYRLLALAVPLAAFLVLAAPAFAQTVAFQPEGPYSGTTQPTDIVRADFDGDGDLDLAAIANPGGTVTIFENTGNGAYFTLPTTFASNASDPSSIDRGDFNGDKKPDLVVTDLATDKVYVLLNNSTPNNISFLPSVPTLTGGDDPTDVAVGDFNNDGKDDLAVTNFTSSDVAILLSDGDGTFTPASSSPVTVSGNPIAADAANFDNKNGLDVVVASYSNNSVTLLINDGNGSFTAAPKTVTVDTGPTDVIARDFNKDGKQDFATANTGSDDISVALGNGDGTFKTASKFFAQTSLISGPPGGIASELEGADYNCDNIPDIAVTSPINNIVQVLPGKGNGTFYGPTAFSVGKTPSGLTSGDFDKPNNGADLATSNFDSNNVSVLLNTSPNCGAVNPNPPPTFTKTDSPDPVRAGHNLTYTLSVTNNGTGTAQNVVITDILPAEVTFVSASSGCTNTSGTVTCNVGSLGSGATATEQIKVQVNKKGKLTNTATVQSPSFPSATATATTKAQKKKHKAHHGRHKHRR